MSSDCVFLLRDCPPKGAVSNGYRYVRYPVMPTYPNSSNCYGYESVISVCQTYYYGTCDLSSRAGAICRGKVVEQVTGLYNKWSYVCI